jgi:hypothetical protein
MTRYAGRKRAGAICAGAAAGLVVIVMAPALLMGCKQAPGPTDATETITLVSTSSSAVEPASVEAIFAWLAASVQPMTVFAPTALPEGATVSPQWLPVIDSADPQTYDGAAKSNPYVVGLGADSEIQVVFRAGQSWLVIIENFHGDLGDVTGTPVGSVAGNAASLYQVNGGELVQWSKDGLWYGIFGRGLERDAILATALGMKVLPGEVP